MKFTIERSALVAAVAPLKGVVQARNTIPILGYLLISATENGAKFTATDLDLALVEHVAANVENEGAATVPAAKLSEIVRRLPSDSEVKFEARDGQVHIRAGRANVRLPSLNANDFPSLQIGRLPHEFTVEAADLFHTIANVRFAMSADEKRYYLCGVYLHIIGASLRAVATDEITIGDDHPPVRAAFQSRYLTVITDQVGSTIRTELASDPALPAVLRDSEDPRCLFVVMTCRG
jgi:DNA polymerase-3 subunit beta